MGADEVKTVPGDGQTGKPHFRVRPNYNLIHATPLPLRIDPLPPLLPHNPLSVLSIAWIYVKTLIWPTKQPTLTGLFSPETRSVHVIDPDAVRALWEHGFFGKGTLSRSEPTWLDREKRRLGLVAADTSEEATRRRRQERIEFKKERARKEREEIEATLQRERTGAARVDSDQISSNSTVPKAEEAAEELMVAESQSPSWARSITTQSLAQPPDTEPTPVNVLVQSKEHLQLTLEEALFLALVLGVLDVRRLSSDGGSARPISREYLFSTFYNICAINSATGLDQNSSPGAFLANYAVYHHFRSLGWVIRPGVKFAVDWMLYNRGPVFSHAEFAVIIVPNYPSSAASKQHESMLWRNDRSWHWLHMVNRVQSQVRKTLVLAFVEMPSDLPNVVESSADPMKILKGMAVREVVLKRWMPNRNRD